MGRKEGKKDGSGEGGVRGRKEGKMDGRREGRKVDGGEKGRKGRNRKISLCLMNCPPRKNLIISTVSQARNLFLPD